MTEEFTETLIAAPTQIGQIDEDLFGKVDLYQVKLVGDIDDIFDYRTQEGTNDGVLDEFYVLAPFSKVGFKASNQATTFTQVKAGAEPMSLFKVFFHQVGHFIELVEASSLDIKSSFDDDAYVWFTLPKIPARMVAELRKFFFAIEDKHGTEAIVVLTYDNEHRWTETPELGWGFAVPEQTNTGGHCDYDKSAIVESLPENVAIVGTVHSHPKMSAFASETDHKDQAGLDGIHITYGWQGNKVEYYAELVRGNNFYRFDPEVVMDLASQFRWEVKIDDDVYEVDESAFSKVEVDFEIPDEDIEKWSENVSKKTWQGNSNINHFSGTKTTSGGGGTNPKALPAPAGTQHAIYNQGFLPEELPKEIIIIDYAKDIPDPFCNNIFMLTPDGATRCAACEMSWSVAAEEINDRRQCLFCGIFIIRPLETIEEVSETREALGYRALEEFMDLERPFVVWNPAAKSYAPVSFKAGETPKVLSH